MTKVYMVSVLMRVWCVSPLSEVVPFYKTDGGFGNHDIGKASVHVVVTKPPQGGVHRPGSA
jgi:hypothetical protein